MRTIGIDVSHWEGAIDWQQVARLVFFAYYKCTDGVDVVDSTFKINQAGCSLAGLAHAPYHFYQPGQDPITQANHFIETAGKLYPRYIVDVEEDTGADEHLPSNLLAFLLRCAQLTGIKPAIYTSPGYWNSFVHGPTWSRNYQLIVAHYTHEHVPMLPIGWTTWIAWQFSDYYFVPGCPTEIDADWFNGDPQACRQWFGNYRPVDPPVISLRARSLFDQLQVRDHPGLDHDQVAQLAKGEAVEIEQLGGDDVWIKHPKGWSPVEIEGYRYMEVIK